MKIHCIHCRKIVSTEIPDDVIIRGTTECPECIARQGADLKNLIFSIETNLKEFKMVLDRVKEIVL